MSHFISFVLALFAVAAGCQAGEQAHPHSAGAGVLVVTAVRAVTVPNDILNASLVAEMTGQEVTRLARQVNQMVARAREVVGKAQAVSLRTLNYSTQPAFENNRRTGWMVRQTVQLESQDFDQASNRLAELQALGLKLEGLGFDLSPTAREQAHLAAKETALRAWMAQADMAVKTLGAKGWKPGRLFLYDGYPPKGDFEVEVEGAGAGGETLSLVGTREGGARTKKPDEKPQPLALDPGETSVVASVKGEAIIGYAP